MSDDNASHSGQKDSPIDSAVGTEDASNTAARGYGHQQHRVKEQYDHDNRQNQPNQPTLRTPIYQPATGAPSMSDGAVFCYAGRPLSSLTDLSSVADLSTALPPQPPYNHDQASILPPTTTGPTRPRPPGEPQSILARVSSGLISGILLPGATYHWQPNFATPQRRYMTLLDQPITDADYGGDILDRDTGRIAGHIAHASQYSRVQVVYMISSADFLASLNGRFQEEARSATAWFNREGPGIALHPVEGDDKGKATAAITVPSISPPLRFVAPRTESIADSVTDSMTGSIAGSITDSFTGSIAGSNAESITGSIRHSVPNRTADDTVDATVVDTTTETEASTVPSMADDTEDMEGLAFQERYEHRHAFSTPPLGASLVIPTTESPMSISVPNASHKHGHRHRHRHGRGSDQHRQLPMQFIHYKGTNSTAERDRSSRSSREGGVGDDRTRLLGLARDQGGSEGTSTGGSRGETDDDTSINAVLPDKKCPFRTCEYHVKGFVRKHDLVRHIITHYDGRLYCGFCPDGLAKSFGRPFLRVEPLKRHLAAVHDASKVRRMQTTTETYLKDRIKEYGWVSVGQCSICARAFDTAPELYNHIEGCVLQLLLKRAKEPDQLQHEGVASRQSSGAVDELALDTGQ